MKILRESMTRVQLGGWKIRVWRQEPGDGGSKPDHAEIAKRVAEVTRAHSDDYVIACFILGLERVNAVEILDGNGCGEVLYKNWP